MFWKQILRNSLRKTAAAVTAAVTALTMIGSVSARVMTNQPVSRIGQVCAGPMYTLYLTPSGSVLSTDSQQTRALSQWKNVVALDAGLCGAAGLTGAGTVYSDLQGNPTASWSGIRKISVGESQIAGVKQDGTVIIGGSGSLTQSDVQSWNNIVDISVGAEHCVGLRSDGTVVAAGRNSYGQCNVQGWRNVQTVCAEEMYTVGLLSNGTVVTAGTTPEEWVNRYNALSDTASWSGIVSIATGPSGIFGIRSDGTLVGCPAPIHAFSGMNEQYAHFAIDWDHLAQISVYHQVAGLQTNGEMLIFGGGSCGESDPCRLTDRTPMHLYSVLSSGLRCVICGDTQPMPEFDQRKYQTCNHELARYFSYADGYLHYRCTLCGAEGIHGPTSVTSLNKLRDTNDPSGNADVMVGTWKSIGGASYTNALKFWVVKRAGYSDTESIDYDLDGQYYNLTGRISVSDQSDPGANMNVNIYLDGNLAARYTNFSSTYSYDFSFDISGAQTLRIECVGTTYAFGHCIVAANVY